MRARFARLSHPSPSSGIALQEGKTALDLAREEGHINVTLLLEAAHARAAPEPPSHCARHARATQVPSKAGHVLLLWLLLLLLLLLLLQWCAAVRGQQAGGSAPVLWCALLGRRTLRTG